MQNVAIDAKLVKSVLYSASGGQRFTQDSPVLPEIWMHLAANPSATPDCLLVPRHGHQAHHVADELQARFQSWERPPNQTHRNAVSDIPGLTTARLDLGEVVNVVMPLTRWWETDGLGAWVEELQVERIAVLVGAAFVFLGSDDISRTDRLSELQASLNNDATQPIQPIPDSTLRILVLIAMLEAARSPSEELIAKLSNSTEPQDHGRLIIRRLDQISVGEIMSSIGSILDLQHLRRRSEPKTRFYADQGASFDPRMIFTLSLNRKADVSSMESVTTTKADAAYRVFNISTAKITWAVIDSGIDATHPAFYRFEDDTERNDLLKGDFFGKAVAPERSRVKAKYDLTILKRFRDRDLIRNAKGRKDLVETVLRNRTGSQSTSSPLRIRVSELVETAFDDLSKGRPFDWELVEELLRVDHSVVPSNDHGTHVAGTLGGAWIEHGREGPRWVYGMCRDIELIDLMVVGDQPETTEFAVIAAQRLVRYLNQRQDFLYVHGVNISMSIPHDVTNYACGRTPVCSEAENLVGNRVVVVAAAGNRGYNQFHTAAGVVDLHTDTSITDPGNAQAVITVGSTHRREPHNYGVSYFSSRGPTGDGRMKPDLVAPGEKINAPVCNGQLGVLEGTSMAAPHVSGAAAILMARFKELRGEPQRIKAILCSSATDLGRERAFQGAGLVDVLRALQSV